MADQAYHLTVTLPFFNTHTKTSQNIGDAITDPEVVSKILNSHHSSFVVKVPEHGWGNPAPTPAPVPVPAPPSPVAAPAKTS